MYYVWCDESDKEGEFYSNFYGGLLIESKNLKRVLNRMEQKIAELDITEEIKWQKVNQHFFEKYMMLVDFFLTFWRKGSSRLGFSFAITNMYQSI